MEKENDLNIKLPKELVNPLIEEKIKLALFDALGDKDQLISNLIETIIKQKVDSSGKHTGNSYSDKFSFIDIVLREHISQAMREATSELIAEKKNVLKDEIKRQLSSKKGAARFASTLLDSTKNILDRNYNMRFEAHFEEMKSNY